MATITIFGDSITYGAVDPEGGGWATRLRNYFESVGARVDKDVDVYNLGISGDNTDDLLFRFKTEMIARKPDIIIFAIGINDSQFVVSKNQSRIPIEKFKENLVRLAGQAREITNKIVFVGLTVVDESKTSPIPWNLDKRYTNKDIERYDIALQEFTQKENLAYIDTRGVLGMGDLSDGLHPNTSGHKKMFEYLKGKIEVLV
ncbi:MAG: GDSL-type esterase/lipase family protein [bacterium]|nr:GDSL-type esterase/lipase family protein [bacterium]